MPGTFDMVLDKFVHKTELQNELFMVSKSPVVDALYATLVKNTTGTENEHSIGNNNTSSVN